MLFRSFQKIFFLLITFIFCASSFATNTKLVASEELVIQPLMSSDVYIDILAELTDHINGVIVLTDNDFMNNHDLILENIAVLETDEEALSKSLDLIALFDNTYGALFTSANTRNGFRREYTSDGLNLHRNIILILQGLIDHGFKREWLWNAPELLEGKWFQTAQYFPGHVDPPANPDVVETSRIKCTYLLAKGSQPWSNIGNPNVIRPTGCYLSPGSIAEVKVPESLVGKEIRIRVGAHFWDLESKSTYKRLDRVSITYNIDDTITRIAHPLGGGVYIEVPLGVDEGIVEISLKNVVRAPFYSRKSFHETSISEWLEKERKHSAPWTDFETDKFMMQVPTSWIYNFDDPETLMKDWDKSMDAVSDLLGRPRITDRHKNYLQFDVVIRGSAYHPGYPMSNTPYNPNDVTDGTPKHKILQGPQYDQDIHFHELGHEVAISKFAGETEALVNFLYVAVLNRCFGYSLDEAFQKSFGPSYNFFSTKDNTVRTRLVANTFHEGEPRNTCSCTKNEVRYQHRGYAHYVDIVELYGWEALEKFWSSEGDAADMGNPFPVNNQEQDDRIFRMSKAAGVDLRPLFHFWGIHPLDQGALAQRMQENNLSLPMDIKAKLHSYRDLIPTNYEEFVEFGNELYPDFLNYSGNQFDFGAGWYQVTAASYNETRASEIEQALSDIIVYYYGTNCFELDTFSSVEFTIDTQYCASDEVYLLPLSSDNGILGSWYPEEVDASRSGLFEYVFVPELDQCAVDKRIEIEVFEDLDLTIDVRSPLCYGDFGSAIFRPSGGSGQGYMFTMGGDSLLAGNYEVFVTDSMGCSKSFSFEVSEPDPLMIEKIDDEVNVHGGVPPYMITTDTSGNVQTVSVVDANGCELTVQFMLSTLKTEVANQIRVFPNPVSKELFLDQKNEHTGIGSLRLLSINGQLISEYPVDAVSLDVSHIGNGVYILYIMLDNGDYLYQKVIVTK